MRAIVPEVEALIEGNQRLVYATVRRFSIPARLRGVLDDDDLVAAGMVGLWKAAETYRDDCGMKFSSYAMNCIRHEMADELRRLAGRGRNTFLADRPMPVSLDAPRMGTDDLFLGDLIADPTAEESYSVMLERLDLEMALSRLRLSMRDWAIFDLLFCRHWDQTKTAKRLGISVSRISQLQRRIIEHLQWELDVVA